MYAPRPNDPILLRGSGYPTYHLGVVIDDHHCDRRVVRSVTHLTATSNLTSVPAPSVDCTSSLPPEASNTWRAM